MERKTTVQNMLHLRDTNLNQHYRCMAKYKD
jgi:hypothetical protein